METLEKTIEEVAKEYDLAPASILIGVCDRETGTFIDAFASVEEAKKAIAEYEEEDKKEGTYAAYFYEIALFSEKYKHLGTLNL